jgi:hypothetical protein
LGVELLVLTTRLGVWEEKVSSKKLSRVRAFGGVGGPRPCLLLIGAANSQHSSSPPTLELRYVPV